MDIQDFIWTSRMRRLNFPDGSADGIATRQPKSAESKVNDGMHAATGL
ncbi:hypothetical protein [Brevundimonas sp.]